MSNYQQILDPQRPVQQKLAVIERSMLDQPNYAAATPPWGQLVSGYSLTRVAGLANFWRREEGEEEIQFSRYMEDLVTGLYGQNLPCAFLILGQDKEVAVYLGVRDVSRAALLEGSLHGAFPDIRAAAPGQDEVDALRQTLTQITDWLALTGVPTEKTRRATNEATKQEEGAVEQIERLVRGLYGQKWAYLVMAEPLYQQRISELMALMLTAITANYPNMKQSMQKGPTISREEVDRQMQQFIERLEQFVERLKLAQAQGGWTVTTHLGAADQITLGRGGALLRAIFAGARSQPEPVRTLRCRVAQPGQPEIPKTPTLLTSAELATLTQLPRREFPGYTVHDYAQFDVAPPAAAVTHPVALGKIMDGNTDTKNWYVVERDDLTKHALVVGVTGSGKTNTIFDLLSKLWQGHRVPFLVIEPAKAEYRGLLVTGKFEGLRVYTLGDERYAPFRLNPFEFELGEPEHAIHVQSHIDYLKSVFNAAFILYAPMPYVLETCLHEIYADRGWDLTASLNRRAPRYKPDPQDTTPLFPTLTDLYYKIDEVVDRLGYEERIAMDVKAGLKARVGSLRLGGKGLMLDTRRGVPMDELLSKPTVLELERIGNDDEKAFLIGILLTRLYEYRMVEHRRERTQGAGREGLRHITVIEEAHRLLKNVSTEVGTEESSTKAGAVEAFANILAEIRAYGQGLVIAEQIPSKLAPDALKNTNLKLMHRIVAQDDREAMGGAMNLSEAQSRIVTTLAPGRVVTYAEKADHPYLIEVADYKGREIHGKPAPDDKAIGAQMKAVCQGVAYERHLGCRQFCAARRGNQGRCPSEIHDVAALIAGEADFQAMFARYILSIVEDGAQAARSYFPLRKRIERGLEGYHLKDAEQHAVVMCVLLGALDMHLSRRGRQYHWFYKVEESFQVQLASVIERVAREFSSDKAKLQALEKAVQADLAQFLKGYRQQTYRAQGPFLPCGACQAKCRYRYAVEPYARDAERQKEFVNVIQNVTDDNAMWRRLGRMAKDIANEVVIGNAAARQGVALCYAVQMGIALNFSSANQTKLVRNIMTAFV